MWLLRYDYKDKTKHKMSQDVPIVENSREQHKNKNG